MIVFGACRLWGTGQDINPNKQAPSCFSYQPAFALGTAPGDGNETPEGSLHSTGETNHPSKITLVKRKEMDVMKLLNGKNCLEFQ